MFSRLMQKKGHWVRLEYIDLLTDHIRLKVFGYKQRQKVFVYNGILTFVRFFRLIRRTKTKFFNGNHLVWDEDSSAGKYVRDNCKPLQVSSLAFQSQSWPSVALRVINEQYETSKRL